MGIARTAQLRTWTASLALAAVGCSTSDGPADHSSGAMPAAHSLRVDAARELVTRDGAFRVAWAPASGAVPVNDHFEVDVHVARNDAGAEPVPGADLSMTCYMPDHGHGMLTEPRAEEIGDGAYRVRGLLLHMGGHWTVSITVVLDGVASTADDALDL